MVSVEFEPCFLCIAGPFIVKIGHSRELYAKLKLLLGKWSDFCENWAYSTRPDDDLKTLPSKELHRGYLV